MTRMCDMCKSEWLDDESTYKRKGVWLCELCFDIINSRAEKSEKGWDDWQDAGGES